MSRLTCRKYFDRMMRLRDQLLPQQFFPLDQLLPQQIFGDTFLDSVTRLDFDLNIALTRSL